MPTTPNASFASIAALYAQHRPTYPDALFAHLASLASGRALAWDAGTGNGQAAIGLARHFQRVIATDASPEQLAHARPASNVEYRCARSEETDLPTGGVQLVASAQAVHWFDLERFYREVRRVAAPASGGGRNEPGGVLAVWCYHRGLIQPEIDALMQHYYHNVVGAYWQECVRQAETEYRNLPFPFEPLPAPTGLAAQSLWSLNDVLGYLRSWSASRRFIEVEGRDPLAKLEPEIAAAWGDPQETKPVRFPLFFRIGRVQSER